MHFNVSVFLACSIHTVPLFSGSLERNIMQNMLVCIFVKQGDGTPSLWVYSVSTSG